LLAASTIGHDKGTDGRDVDSSDEGCGRSQVMCLAEDTLRL
jgi:hypothetical protein